MPQKAYLTEFVIKTNRLGIWDWVEGADAVWVELRLPAGACQFLSTEADDLSALWYIHVQEGY